MRKITTMPTLNANLSTESMKMRGAQRAGIILALACFLMLASSAGAQFTPLYNFGTHVGDPAHPNYPGFVVQGRDGNLYSTSYDGGTDNAGTVFKVTPAGQVTVLYSFDGVTGAFPSGGLTLGSDGNFYGTTFENGPSNYGTVFKITSGGKLTVLHAFDSTDGEGPWGAPVQGTDGAYYGTTEHGGSAECGTVYRVTAAGTFKTLYNFDGPHGCQPLAPLVLGTDGNFYGTTLVLTGVTNPNLGAIYKITTAGAITLLHSFDGTHGAEAYAPLMQASNGNFYGATVNGGLYGNGVVFEMSPAGAYTDLHDFDPNTEGGEPFSALIEGTDGVLYGTTAYGGTYNAGTIYSIPLSGGNSNTLYSFDSASGRAPGAPVTQHTNGTFYSDSAWGGSDDLGTFYSFSAGLSPFVRLVTAYAKVGKTVEILGQGFTGTTAVSFNGTSATFHVASKTYLTAIVPIGATSGFIKVTTPGGTLESNQAFLVIP
ncbi:MAG: choice-of-anchor tandem repeat GloVer-containing protein [Candidatus Sulfotelmatobacter sp.]